jgi:hypothetical protein
MSITADIHAEINAMRTLVSITVRKCGDDHIAKAALVAALADVLGATVASVVYGDPAEVEEAVLAACEHVGESAMRVRVIAA